MLALNDQRTAYDRRFLTRNAKRMDVEYHAMLMDGTGRGVDKGR